MPKQVIAPANVHPARGYSHAYKVGNTVYVAGQVGVNLQGQVVGIGDCAAQCEQAYQNMERVLEVAGATMRDVVKITEFFKDINDRPQMREARKKHFGDHFPASTAVQVVGLALPEFLIEVEAVAVIDS